MDQKADDDPACRSPPSLTHSGLSGGARHGQMGGVNADDLANPIIGRFSAV